MKVLLRDWNEDQYVWETAKYDGKRFLINGKEVYITDIVSIMNDNRLGYVKCEQCGAFFKNDPKKIEEHRHRYAKEDACLTCNYLKVSTQNKRSEKITREKDGTYLYDIKTVVNLSCKYRRHYSTVDIHSDEAKQNCALRQCIDANIAPFQDFFTQYPNAFDQIAMVDKILDIGYKNVDVNQYYSYYKLKGRNTIIAYVNRYGMIDSFDVSYDNDSYHVYYSKKYDMFFSQYGSRYIEWKSYWPENTEAYIKNKIKELYN